MTQKEKIEKAREAIKTLIEIGAESYIDPSQAKDSEKFGLGLSKVISDPQFSIEACAEHCEDWNAHAEARLLRAIAVDQFTMNFEDGKISLIPWK